MDADDEVGGAGGARGESRLEDLLVPAAILERLPDAVVAADREGRIVSTRWPRSCSATPGAS
jgi:hypothetical protein